MSRKVPVHRGRRRIGIELHEQLASTFPRSPLQMAATCRAVSAVQLWQVSPTSEQIWGRVSVAGLFMYE